MTAMINGKYNIILLMVLLLLISVTVVSCQEKRGSIEGSVFTPSGAPAENITIRAENPVYSSVLLSTDENGDYRITDIPIGKWTVSFFNFGVQVGMETVAVLADETTTLDFTIGEKPVPEHQEIINVP